MHAFTKLMRPLLRFWRSQGLKSIIYIDDGICAVTGRQEAVAASDWVRDTLHKAGLVVNCTKSIWEPSHRVQWLGFDTDLLQGCVMVPKRKIEMLKHTVALALTQQKIRASSLASIVGKIISMGIAV